MATGAKLSHNGYRPPNREDRLKKLEAPKAPGWPKKDDQKDQDKDAPVEKK